MTSTARVDINLTGVASPPPVGAVPTARVFLVGQTQRGPVVPTLVRGEADYRVRFGDRATLGAAMYDAAKSVSREAPGTDIWVVRAAGPAPVKASTAVGTLTVTAREYGAHANTWTAAWDATAKTLTVVRDGGTEAYTGTTLAELLAAAAASKRVAVTGTALPGTTVAATTLTGGTDDYANVVWADVVGGIPADLGVGAVLTPGVAHSVSGAALAAHARTYRRLALLSPPAGSTLAEGKAAVATAAALTGGEFAAVAWPQQTYDGDTTAPWSVDGAVYAAGARARAHALSPAQSPILRAVARSRAGAVPAATVTETEWADADEAGLCVIRTLAGYTTLDGWHTAAPFPGLAVNGAQYRDFCNVIAAELQAIADGFIGRLVDGRGITLAELEGAMKGLLEGYARARALYARVDPLTGDELDPGYTVDTSAAVNPVDELALGKVHAVVKVRLSPTAEFFTIDVFAYKADGRF